MNTINIKAQKESPSLALGTKILYHDSIEVSSFGLSYLRAKVPQRSTCNAYFVSRHVKRLSQRKSVSYDRSQSL